jgi:hypothetical protein
MKNQNKNIFGIFKKIIQFLIVGLFFSFNFVNAANDLPDYLNIGNNPADNQITVYNEVYLIDKISD